MSKPELWACVIVMLTISWLVYCLVCRITEGHYARKIAKLTARIEADREWRNRYDELAERTFAELVKDAEEVNRGA